MTKLPARDYVLLPLIGLITIVTLLAGGEVAARLLYAEHEVVSCAYQIATGAEARYRPNCVSRTKAAEGQWVVDAFNDCGYRTVESCAVRGLDQLRVVVMGSSVARGAMVDYTETFSARAGAELTQSCHKVVDFQNLGTDGGGLYGTSQRIAEALALKPTVIAIIIGRYDLEHLRSPLDPPEATPAKPSHFNLHYLDSELRKSRLFFVGQHYVYQDPEVHITAFLSSGADRSRYVLSPLPETWTRRVREFGEVLGNITAQSDRAGVPLFIFYVPDRPQAGLAIRNFSRPGISAFALPNALRDVSVKKGVTFVDITPDFGSASNFRTLYAYSGHERPSFRLMPDQDSG